ncbi:MAG: prolipoprotein diacylglyceryl transferase [Acidimicrobiales bacterium]|nr:prolipoprotein diacylglyceryl transferase [Acidimicrobiales bacterium]
MLTATTTSAMMVLSSIPSPGSDRLRLGPLNLRMYGLMIALGVLAAVGLGRRRWSERGGNPDDIVTIAMWAVPAGLVGARLYHVITDWKTYFPDRPIETLYVWQGGLGIPGGIIGGTLVGVIVARRMGIRLPAAFDMAAPCIPLAQAIGRWGNWFNQELFGRPTTLPWGLEVSPERAVAAGYQPGTTFHPTFLYESLWNLALVVFLLWLDKKRVLRPGRLFAAYVGGYFLGRLWVESLRADTASLILGVRVNIWTSLFAIVGSSVVLFMGGITRRSDDSDAPYVDGQASELRANGGTAS